MDANIHNKVHSISIRYKKELLIYYWLPFKTSLIYYILDQTYVKSDLYTIIDFVEFNSIYRSDFNQIAFKYHIYLQLTPLITAVIQFHITHSFSIEQFW